MSQKVKTNKPLARAKPALQPSHKLERITFSTSRAMDFFSEGELVSQTGHSRREWPLVIVKELVDNALDACDEADTPPVVTITCDASGITVADNGPGLPESTLLKAMDFNVRASNREAYQAPDRGRQGNALKTLLPMPAVLSPQGLFVVEACGKRHSIRCTADPVTQEPAILDDAIERETVGTSVRLDWTGVERPFSPCDIGLSRHKNHVMALVLAYAAFNPHASITLNWFGETTHHAATDTAFAKWKPCQPTSPHWYDDEQFRRLVGAYIGHDRATGTSRLISDFLRDFDGYAGSAKRSKVLDAAGMKRSRLHDLLDGDKLDAAATGALLAAMKAHTKPVTSRRLGTIGEQHLAGLLAGLGCIPESISYQRKFSTDALPHVIEVCFGVLDDTPGCGKRRVFLAGANWSAAVRNPFRSFGSTGEGLEAVLAEARAGTSEPICLVVHLAKPGVRFTDRGKSALVIDDEGGADE